MPFAAIPFGATRFIATLVMASLGRADYPRFTLRGLLALLILLAGHSARADERWQSDSYLVESFMAIAMEREYGEARQTRFARWQQPIRLQLINESGDKPLQADVVKVQAAHLARITGHPISMVAAKPNLTLIMTDYSKMKSWANRTMGGRSIGQDGAQGGALPCQLRNQCKTRDQPCHHHHPGRLQQSQGALSRLRGRGVHSGDGAAQRFGQGVSLHLQ